MQLFINPRTGVPIYRQLMQQIKTGITAGILAPGEKMPTVREVALELTINPNTVARAYRELEIEGLLSSTQGKGTYVAKGLSPPSKERKQIFQEKVMRLIVEGEQLKLSPKIMESIFLEAIREGGKND